MPSPTEQSPFGRHPENISQKERDRILLHNIQVLKESVSIISRMSVTWGVMVDLHREGVINNDTYEVTHRIEITYHTETGEILHPLTRGISATECSVFFSRLLISGAPSLTDESRKRKKTKKKLLYSIRIYPLNPFKRNHHFISPRRKTGDPTSTYPVSPEYFTDGDKIFFASLEEFNIKYSSDPSLEHNFFKRVGMKVKVVPENQNMTENPALTAWNKIKAVILRALNKK